MQFKQTTEEQYWEMLGCLPPAAQTGYGFLVGEPMDHNSKGQPRFTAFFEYPIGNFLESVQPLTVSEFKTASENLSTKEKS